MDKRDAKAREYIAQRCELLGAVRLPNNAFQENAGIRINTDILFLQKLDAPRILEKTRPEWVETETVFQNDYTDETGRTKHNVVT